MLLLPLKNLSQCEKTMRFLYKMMLPQVFQVTQIYTAPINDGSGETEIVGLRVIDKTANWPFEGREDSRDFAIQPDEDYVYYNDGESRANHLGGVLAISEDKGDLVAFGKLAAVLPVGTKVTTITEHMTITRGAAKKMLKKHHGYPSKNLWFDGPINNRTYDRCMKWLAEGAQIVLLETNDEPSEEEIAWREENMR